MAGIILASFTINPPEVHFRDGTTRRVQFVVHSREVDIAVKEEESWWYWGSIDRDVYEKALANSLPITYRFEMGKLRAES